MSIKIDGTTVEILGKAYQLKCAEADIAMVQKAADYVEEKMQSIRATSQVISMDRLAVITALTLSHELLTLEHEKFAAAKMLSEQINHLETKIDDALNEPIPGISTL